MTLPVPLRFVAQLLRQDRTQATGRAVLFASIVGFDTFAAHITELAPLCGVGEARLRELVTIGRQALSETSPKVREQHLVSRALLREFCRADAHGDGLLVSHALRSGRNRPTGPGGVAYREHFVKIDSRETERIWGRVEQELPTALATAYTRRVLGQPKHLAVIKGTVALHFARSPDVLDGQAATLRQAIDTLHAEYLRNWPLVEALYYMKHRLYPPTATAPATRSPTTSWPRRASLQTAAPCSACESWTSSRRRATWPAGWESASSDRAEASS